ncbi:OmpH family outer membrane protein [candidate division KSB1 bacterium]|nr:OmpH family outer membrane protein [candidate division KSB1 bacterium]NIR69371.1 OmpH family outer membrane protein [candidate division KSB1 bacterium]NIS24189.1 OmpH family outer membrane protein [candidate division KSB1 bacterium]NIT71104.1 OmpH family outer membrane protein [candidate division KSB1 bacterium]NIU24808.1 OmpH family outer membrane protein [candidate division KSB1 bacterium]
MKGFKLSFSLCLVLTTLLVVGVGSTSAQLKIGYVNSNKVLATYKEAQDVREKLRDLNAEWEKEAKGMQKQIQDLQEQLESQSLLLSEERKQEKQQEIQSLYLKYQQFLNEKWGAQGEAIKKEEELLEPVIKKINVAIKNIGEAEGYSYIFDTVAANILYASEDQTDLTERLLKELNKGVPAKTNSNSN